MDKFDQNKAKILLDIFPTLQKISVVTFLYKV